MPRTNQELIDLHHAGRLDPGECEDCVQNSWNPGYDRGDDPRYIGFQCRGCGAIIGRTHESVAPGSVLDHESTREELNAVFVGRTVTVAGDDVLVLDDGTKLRVIPNAPSCCSKYDITELNGCDNVITGAKIVEDDQKPNAHIRDPHTYRLFVYSGHKKINLLTVDGDDGTGYYGTGFIIYVTAPRE